ncbi:MAG: GDP-mannose 4,6-dehydratase, partial [Actinobacteria bacterium]|nr:GDP-mannose 4,6-dehydratase [Actinomycetota bacterium]
MTVLVTGGAGFIGSHFCRRLIEMKSRVVCMDNFNDYYDPAIKEKNISDIIKSSRFALYRADILDRCAIEKIFSENDIGLIV